MPPTIQALLQARLDQLGGDERSVIERGAVEGEVFHRLPVAELASRPGPARARRPSREADPQRAHPAGAGDDAGRRRLPLPSSPDPRRRVRLAAEGDARRPARALRALDRRARPARRAGRDRRLPPRTGCALPARARTRGRCARSTGRPPARRGGSRSARARRQLRGGEAARTRDDAPLPGLAGAARVRHGSRPRTDGERSIRRLPGVDRRAGDGRRRAPEHLRDGARPDGGPHERQGLARVRSRRARPVGRDVRPPRGRAGARAGSRRSRAMSSGRPAAPPRPPSGIALRSGTQRGQDSRHSSTRRSGTCARSRCSARRPWTPQRPRSARL